MLQELQKLLILEQNVFQDQSIMNSDGGIRFKTLEKEEKELPKWDELKQRAPNYLSQKFQKVRSPLEYGKQVHAYFDLMLEKNLPARSLFSFWPKFSGVLWLQLVRPRCPSDFFWAESFR